MAAPIYIPISSYCFISCIQAVLWLALTSKMWWKWHCVTSEARPWGVLWLCFSSVETLPPCEQTWAGLFEDKRLHRKTTQAALAAPAEAPDMWVGTLGQWQYHSSILAWKIPWTDEPGGLQSMDCQRVRQDWARARTRSASQLSAKAPTDCNFTTWDQKKNCLADPSPKCRILSK